jgi:DNA-binding winged helix-turn-helix (wHTH) protein
VRARFTQFTIDSDTRQLLRHGEEIHLSPKAFDLLWTLVQSRPKVIEKADLHARIWPDTFVVEANLNVLIGEIRRAIGDNPHHAEYIRTVHGVGYAFCAAAVDLQPTDAGRDTLCCWVIWKKQTYSLSEGDNIVGRDPRCGVWLDVAGVSRNHARIRIDSVSRRVVLEDLGSTNGTFLAGSRIQGEVALASGDEVTIGTVDLTIRLWNADTVPATKRIRRKHK